jgi:general secretion pathway protein L
MSAKRILFLPTEAGAPARTLIMDASGTITSRGVFTLDLAPISHISTILVVPGADVLARWLELPGATKAQAEAAARLLLGETVASPVDGLHIAVGSGEEGGRRLICVIERARMQALLEQANRLGIVPDHVVPDHLMLPAPADGSILVAEWDGRRLLRGKHLAAAIETDAAELLTKGRPTRNLSGFGAVENAVAAAAEHLPVDLLQNASARGSIPSWSFATWRRAAALAAALFLSPLLLWGAQAARSEWAARSVEARTEDAARAIAGSVADPVALVEARVNALAANDQLLHMAASLFTGTATLEGAELERIAWLSDQRVLSATLLHQSAADIEALSETLRDAGLTLSEDGSTEAGGRLSTSIAVRPAP